MLRVIIFVLAVAGAATQALAQSADKAIIAHTSESISARRFRLDTPVAEESYRIVRQSLSDDGTIAQANLQEFIEQVRKEPGMKKNIAANELIDFCILREVAKDVDGKS